MVNTEIYVGEVDVNDDGKIGLEIVGEELELIPQYKPGLMPIGPWPRPPAEHPLAHAQQRRQVWLSIRLHAAADPPRPDKGCRMATTRRRPGIRQAAYCMSGQLGLDSRSCRYLCHRSRGLGKSFTIGAVENTGL